MCLPKELDWKEMWLIPGLTWKQQMFRILLVYIVLPSVKILEWFLSSVLSIFLARMDCSETMKRSSLVRRQEVKHRQFLKGLALRLPSLEKAQSSMSVFGRCTCRKNLITSLETRAHTSQTIEQNPDILKVPIMSPIFIIGLPRTDSSLLHELLALDKRLKVSMLHEMIRPCPLPDDRDSIQEDPRYKAQAKQLGMEVRRLVLKYFQNMRHLDAILKIYPDAKFIWIHQKIIEVITSCSSLREKFCQFLSVKTTNSTMGKRAQRNIQFTLAAAIKTDQTWPIDPICHIKYKCLVENTVGTMREIYRQCGLEFQEDLAQKYIDYLQKSPQGKRDKHGVTME